MELLFLLFIIPIFSAAACELVEYSDLEALGVACYPRDVCSNQAVRQFFERNCECDSSCHSFDDCCVDAPTAGNRNTVRRHPAITCLPFDSSGGVYAIGKCSNSWNGPDALRTKCENEDDFSDPLISLPSTDTHTNLTYKNHYCAECNHASLESLALWDPQITCGSLAEIDAIYHNVTQDFIVGSISRLGNSWGIYHWNESQSDVAFYPCEISFRLPSHLTPHVRYCRPGVISTCAANWRRNLVRRQCLEYMAVIHFGDKAYRNVHCALCNRVSIRNPTCSLLLVRTNPSLSFTLLLDVNPSDGDTVGETSSCASGQKYDPFFKKCRKLVCALPGHVFKGGRCVPQ